MDIMNDNKPKVLILQNEISNYNVSTYNEIAKEVSLTLGYYDKDKSTGDCLFAKHHFGIKKIGPFIFVKGARQYCRQFDVVCTMPNIRIPSYSILPFLRHRYCLISWGIGFRCSYKHPYLTDRKHGFLDNVYKLILERCDANVFYMEQSKDFWRNTTLRMDNVFVAPNTTDVARVPYLPEIKKDFLFVGTLYKGKGLDILLEAFKQFKNDYDSEISLTIVGSGELEEELKTYTKMNSLDESVIFTGPIYDEPQLAKFFQKSLLCFSPTQAGLSVPKSMGYGVPFVTRKDAITGGEIHHITNGVNGVIYSEDSDLKKIMADALSNREKYVTMGSKAKEYYDRYATIKDKAKGVLDAIYYVLMSR